MQTVSFLKEDEAENKLGTSWSEWEFRQKLMKLEKGVMNHRTLGHGGELRKSLIFSVYCQFWKMRRKEELFQINLKCVIYEPKKKEIIFLQLEIWTQKPRIHSESRGFVLNLNTSVMYLFFFFKKRKETLEINSYLKLNLHFICQWKRMCFPWSVRWSLQEMPEAKFCLLFFFFI